jgi:aryl-alcohol dehydrogenase-like predicted oxidoreductase
VTPSRHHEGTTMRQLGNSKLEVSALGIGLVAFSPIDR